MNVSSLKTPGVYINEIDAFPPSVANVATAIPAFIGYTEKGPMVPTRITSFLEYEQIFGGAPVPASVNVELDANLVPTENCSVEESKFKLYNSLKLFYANGGGICYIVKIGSYTDNINDKGIFTAGLDLLRKFDEPTLLLFPDAVNLGSADLGEVQKYALIQCSDLMDRFSIMDVQQKAGVGLDPDCVEFRDRVGNQNLKYGASYYPYLQSSFPYSFRFNDINGTAQGKVDFYFLYNSDEIIKPLLDNFASLKTDVYNSSTGLIKNWNSAKTAYLPVDPVANKTDVANFALKLWNLLKTFGKPSALTNPKLKAYLNNSIAISLKPITQKLVDFEFKFNKIDNTYTPKYSDTTISPTIKSSFDDLPWKYVGSDFIPSDSKSPTENNFYNNLLTSNAADTTADYSKIKAQLNKLYSTITKSLDNLIVSIENFVMAEEKDLTKSIPIYSSIIDKLSQTMNTLPPSGAIAGIYAQIDAARGVWKSPANVSINGIIGLTADINDKEQENMNIHETGKSINALRKFTGKGFLVWGGRTLAGNSNDWRYINVRRLANMIEESAKKACMQFVFEPNVAQTWVNVKGMINNYLTTLWNDGALAGAKPEHAFFVQVGLNETMTAQDINEGRLVVKIGYAPSRPAEFIILEFKQMQQRS